jgi:class 3 adenylate cyclase
VDVEPSGDQPGAGRDAHADVENPAKGPIAWLKKTNRNPDVVALIRRARTALPGDPDFGDPLSVAGDGGAQAAARAADRILRDRDAATREVGLATLQVWQAITERVARRPADSEVTIVFTDLVGFSDWSLQAGDEATLRLLRRVAQVAEPPFLDAGGQIVKRMGDGIMVVFQDAVTAVRATIAAREAVKTVEVDGYTPRVRAGIHTGRPQRIGGDWLGVDVNIAARVMERATRGGLIVSENTLQQIPQSELEALGVTVKRVRRQVFTGRQSGVPADLVMYRLKTKRDVPGEDDQPDGEADRPD